MQPEDKNLESNILYKSKWLRPCPFCGKILLKFREIIKIVQLNRAETVGKKFRQRPPLQDIVAGTPTTTVNCIMRVFLSTMIILSI